MVRGRAYNVGTERNNRTVAEIAAGRGATPCPAPSCAITGETGNDPRSYRVDFSRARKELGFEARLDDPGRRRRSWRRSTASATSPSEQFDQRFTRLAVLAARQQAGELDETMRVRSYGVEHRPRPPAASGLVAE